MSTPSSGRRDDALVGVLLVAGQFLLLAAIVLLPGGTAWALPTWAARILDLLAVAGLALVVVGAMGLGRGLTAMPLPNVHARLRTGGLYRWVRHPIYSGLLLFALCRATVSGSVLAVAAFVLLAILLTAKARWEERRLVERFPDYPDYASRTGRFVPRLSGGGAPPT